MSCRAWSNAKYGMKFETGHIVIVKLNTKEGIVEFYHAMNESEQSKLSGTLNIEQRDDLSYRLATTIYYNNHCIKLIKFQASLA